MQNISFINKYKKMLLHDIWLLVKKIMVGVLLFIFPVAIVFGLLWLMQFFILK